MSSFLISPELALIDPELRRFAISAMNELPDPPRPVVVPWLPRAEPRPKGRVVAAGVYLAAATLRVLFLDALFVVVVSVVVAALSLVG